MTKDPSFYLSHILESINKINNYLDGVDKEEFLDTNMLKDAVIRNLEVIGEAIKNIPSDFKVEHPATPWRDIAGMRDRIVHFYFGINYDLVWETIKNDLPELEDQIEVILKKMKK
ncbi:MAG: DUF86 domain-containing protein [Candidatus Micrarchaeota archaeon]